MYKLYGRIRKTRLHCSIRSTVIGYNIIAYHKPLALWNMLPVGRSLEVLELLLRTSRLLSNVNSLNMQICAFFQHIKFIIAIGILFLLIV